MLELWCQIHVRLISHLQDGTRSCARPRSGKRPQDGTRKEGLVSKTKHMSFFVLRAVPATSMGRLPKRGAHTLATIRGIKSGPLLLNARGFKYTC